MGPGRGHPRASRAARRARPPAGGGRTGATPSPTGGSMGSASTSRSGARRGRNGSSSSPRERAWSRAPSSPNRATSALRGSSATGPDPPQPEPGQAGPDVGIRRAGAPTAIGARNPASPPGSTSPGDRRARRGRPRPSPRTASRRSRRGRRRRPGRAARAHHEPLDEDRLGAPQPVEPVDLELDQPEGGIGGSVVPASPGLNRASVSKAASTAARVRVRLRVEEGRLRGEPVRAPERHPAPDAERPGRPDRRRSPVPSVHGWPPRTTGRSVGNDSERRARASRSGRWGQ